MCGVEEQVQGHDDGHNFSILLRLIERQLQDFKTGTSSGILSTAYSVLLLLKLSRLWALEKPFRNLPLERLSQNDMAVSEIVIFSPF